VKYVCSAASSKFAGEGEEFKDDFRKALPKELVQSLDAPLALARDRGDPARRCRDRRRDRDRAVFLADPLVIALSVSSSERDSTRSS
jgi:hypothetical protein